MSEAPKPYYTPPKPLPARMEDLTPEHLEEADEDDATLVRVVLLMTLLGMDPERENPEASLLEIVVGNDKGDDLCPGWVHGVAACVEGMWEMSLKLKLEEALQGVVPHKLGQRVAVESIAGAGLDNPGDGVVTLFRRRIGRRRRRALGMPVDERHERRDRRRLKELVDLIRRCGEGLAVQIAQAQEREMRQAQHRDAQHRGRAN